MPTTVSVVLALPTMASNRDPISKPCAVAKAEIDRHLVGAAGFRQPAPADEQVIDRDIAAGGNRDQEPGRRLAEALDIEERRLDDPRLDRGDAIDGGDLIGNALRCPDGGSENVAELVALVVGGAGFLKRTMGADGQNEGSDAAGHDQGDGERLGPQPAKIAEELDVEGSHRAHQFTAEGARRLSF